MLANSEKIQEDLFIQYQGESSIDISERSDSIVHKFHEFNLIKM